MRFRWKNFGRAVAAICVMFFGAQNAPAATINLSFDPQGTASFTRTLSAQGSFADIFLFSLNGPSLLGANITNVVIQNVSTFSAINGFGAGIFSAQDDQFANPLAVLSFSSNTLSVQNGNLGAGNFVLRVTGNVSGSGALYTGAIVTSAVPVPAAAWLMGSAMIGLIGISRRGSQRSNL